MAALYEHFLQRCSGFCLWRASHLGVGLALRGFLDLLARRSAKARSIVLEKLGALQTNQLAH
ncbi:MAG: hypothetical protein IT462_10555 [Planctomycetes bacterium]|nr:hypothetical protein [Planctomycetota bacterium]